MKLPMKLILCAVLTTGLVAAQTPRRAARQANHVALGLSPQQKTQMLELRANFMKQSEPMRVQMQQNHQALLQAEQANDLPKIHELTTIQGQLQGQIAGFRSEMRAKRYSLLTPEQRAKLPSPK